MSGPGQGSSGDEEEEEGLDWEKISGYLRFVTGALRRRWWVAGGIFVVGAALTYTVFWLMPRAYLVETQLLAQKNPMNVTGGQQRGDSPTRAAAETVLRRDNLIALLEKSEVVKYWEQTRSNASRVRGWINQKLGRPPMSEADKMDMLVGTLESKLAVETKADWAGEGTVTITLEWSDAKMGYRLVNAAQQSFIEARHLTEISAISEGMSILLGRAASMREEIDSLVKKIEAKKTKGKTTTADADETPAPRRPSAAAPSATPTTTASDREAIQQLQSLWEGKKSAIKDLEDHRRKRIDELQTKLLELRATYADSHPSIVDTQQTIETLSQESPQLVQLKREEAALRNQYLGRAAKLPEGATVGMGRHAPRGTSARAAAEPNSSDDRETEFAKAQLRFTGDAYDDLLARIEGSHMELETARAALKYRYTVVKPPQMPREPIKPKAAKILGGGVVASLLFAVLAAIALDLRSGRVYERWQLERALRLPVLAEIRREF